MDIMNKIINVLTNPLNAVLILVDALMAAITFAEFTDIVLRIVTTIVGAIVAYYTVKRIRLDLELLGIKKDREIAKLKRETEEEEEIQEE